MKSTSKTGKELQELCVILQRICIHHKWMYKSQRHDYNGTERKKTFDHTIVSVVLYTHFEDAKTHVSVGQFRNVNI